MDNLGTHLLWCILWEWMYSTHDTLWDIVVTITLESGAHVLKEVSHLFPLPHPMMNGYPCHWRRLWDVDGHHHC